MLTYETLDAVFKFTKNPDYYRLPAQVNQNAMQKTFHAWKSFYAALEDFDAHPEKYKEKPRIPGYIREKEATAWFTNQTARTWKAPNGCLLFFTGTSVTAGCGTFTGTYIKTEVGYAERKLNSRPGPRNHIVFMLLSYRKCKGKDNSQK